MANITKLPSGNYRARVFLGRDVNGKQIYKSFTADKEWKVLKAVEEYLEGGKEEVEKALYERNMTVGQAIDGYIELKRNVLAPSTIMSYERIRKTRLKSLMNVKVENLESVIFQRAINEDSTHYSFKSIKEAKSLILTALKLYGFRPDITVTLPPKTNNIKSLPTAETIISIVKNSSVELPCLLAMWLSLRMSEVRGLKFKDVQDGVLYIQRAKVYFDCQDFEREVTKTQKSTRALRLPAYLLDLINSVPHSSDNDYIVPDSYKALSDRFKRLMNANGIEMRFHDLRHLNASVMLMLGIPDKYAMERGGWSTPSVLKSVYQHTFSDERKLVDKRIDDYYNSLIVDTTVDTK